MSVIMATVTLGLRISSKKVERVVLKDINLSDKVEIIRQEASKRTNTAPEKIVSSSSTHLQTHHPTSSGPPLSLPSRLSSAHFMNICNCGDSQHMWDICNHKQSTQNKAYITSQELIHCGVRLKGNDSLQDAGITSGAVIHCLPKKGYQTAPIPAPIGISEVQQLLLSLRTLVGNTQFRPFIQKLKTPEMVEKVMAACPEVQRDPMALALMQDPELVLGLVNPDHLSNVVEEHPAVAQVIHFVCGLVSSQSSSQRSHHVSYSMDALSDDEQMEEGGEWQAGSSSSNNSSLPPITPAQLAAALASAAGNGSSTSSSSRTSRNSGTSLASTSAPQSQPAAEAGPITAQMFSQALQNALAASSRTASSTPFMGTSQASGSPGATSAPIPNLDESLQLMREMGIPDEELSKQALQATNGDVQAAVNLIFAQWMADDDNV